VEYFWKDALESAIARNRRDAHHRYIHLATHGEDGYPANRTVVFRGFGDAGELKIVTDRRSGKVRQIAANSAAEVCWYFTRSREQFRIRGRLSIIDATSPDAARRETAWQALSEAAREQFYWAAPGQPLADAATPENPNAGPPDTFLLVLLAPERIEHLQLSPTPQRRYVSSITGGAWSMVPVNP
jgi:PPOX class probable FMN-dependent enzyme